MAFATIFLNLKLFLLILTCPRRSNCQLACKKTISSDKNNGDRQTDAYDQPFQSPLTVLFLLVAK